MGHEGEKKIAGGMSELSDEALDRLAGGNDFDVIIRGERMNKNAIDMTYHCPKCGYWLQYKASRYYCLICDESWSYDDPRLPSWR